MVRKQVRPDVPVSPEAEAAIAARRQAREGRVLRLARAQLRAASRELVEQQPKRARWYCLQVSGGHEFALETLLNDSGVEALAPREPWTKVRAGRKIEGSRALLPGYLLVRVVGSPEAFDGLRKQTQVRGVVGGACGYHVVRDADVAVFKQIKASDIDRMETDKSFADGDRAAIEVGPFAGFECLVLAVKWSRRALARIVIDVDGNPFEIESIPLAFLKKL